MNTLNLIGRLNNNPELIENDEGEKICNFFISVDDMQSKFDRADLINCSVSGIQGENCFKYLKKGFLVGVTGRFRSDSIEEEQGQLGNRIICIVNRVQFLQWPIKSSDE